MKDTKETVKEKEKEKEKHLKTRRIERQKKENIFSVLQEDITKYILSFLDNRTLVNMLLCCKKIRKMYVTPRYHSPQNLFTSITVLPHDNLMDCIRRYIDHSHTIKKTILVGMKEPDVLWPFKTREMVYIR